MNVIPDDDAWLCFLDKELETGGLRSNTAPAEVPHLRTLFKIEQVLRRLRRPVRPLTFEGLDSRKKPERKSNNSKGSPKTCGA